MNRGKNTPTIFLAKGKIQAGKMRKATTLYDATLPLSEKTIVYPGDPTLKITPVSSLEVGDICNVSKIEMGSHFGTHVDFPRHVFRNGATSDFFPIDRFTGRGVIIDVPSDIKVISSQTLCSTPYHDIDSDLIILLKTRNSMLWNGGSFVEDYVYLDISAAEWLISKRPRLVGIDYVSVDVYNSGDLPVHRLLLSNNIPILENLDLSGISGGYYDIYCLPISIVGIDALPARVLIKKIMRFR